MAIDIEKILLRSRCYPSNDSQIEPLIEIWRSAHPDYLFHIVSSHKADIYSVKIPHDNKFHIVWDTYFWELFKQFIYIIDEEFVTPHSNTNTLVENNCFTMGLFIDYLSKRYTLISDLSDRLSHTSNAYGFSILQEHLAQSPIAIGSYDYPVLLCKAFVMWHEISHIEFEKYDIQTQLRQQYFGFIYSLLNYVSDEAYSNIPNSLKIKKQIQTRTLPSNLLEELAADLRAFQHLFNIGLVTTSKSSISLIITHYHTLLDFIFSKALADKRWDHFVLHHPDNPPLLAEEQLLRKHLLPIIITHEFSSHYLNNTLIYELQKKREYTELYLRLFSFFCEDSAISSYLNEEYFLYALQNAKTWNLFQNALAYVRELQPHTSEKQLKYLFNIAYTAQKNDPLSCVEKYYEFIRCAKLKEGTSQAHIADAYSRIARVLADNGSVNMAKQNIDTAIDIADTLSDDKSNAFLFNNIANALRRLNLPQKALMYYLRSEELHKRYGSEKTEQAATVYMNIGNTYILFGNSSLAMYYYLKCYLILNNRYDFDNSRIQEMLDGFSLLCREKADKTVVQVYSVQSKLEVLRSNYDLNASIFNFVQLLYGIARDILIAPFPSACELYIELFDRIAHNHYSADDIATVCDYAFINMRSRIDCELFSNQ